MKKVLLTATVQSHIAQFHKPLIEMLQENGYEVHVAARDNLDEKNGLKLDTPNKVYDIPFDRSPLGKNNIIAYNKLEKIMRENQYDIIHCNTPMGGVITRLAARKVRKMGTKIIYTAHGFHFYKGAPIINWLIFYPFEKQLALYTDTIITISEEDYELAKKKFSCTNIEHIHGVGANENKFKVVLEQEKIKLREKFGYRLSSFICLCTGELNKNKNQAILIKALPTIIKKIPEFKLLLAGNGPLYNKLNDMVKELNVNEHVQFLGYRTDLENFVNLSDLCVSASIREGLGLNVIEGMLCGKPVVVSNNRGHRELVSNMVSGVIVDAMNATEFSDSICRIYENTKLADKIRINGIHTASRYTTSTVKYELEEIYKRIIFN